MTITAAADGSALGNPGPAGWAWYIDDNTWRAGGWAHGTNNMGELKAVLDLLETTGADPHTADEHLLILCDSQYVINSVTKWMPGWKRKGWKKKDGKPVQNVELMQDIDGALQGRNVDFEWVKGHAGHPMNEAADARANAAATAFSRRAAPDEGPGLSGFGVEVSIASEDRSSPGAGAATAPPASQTSQASQAADREIALYTDEVRSDRAKAAELLHPDLTVVDGDGRVLNRDEFLNSLKPLRGFDALEVSDVLADEVGASTVLVRSATSGPYGHTQCSSLWLVREDTPLLRYHQETPRNR